MKFPLTYFLENLPFSPTFMGVTVSAIDGVPLSTSLRDQFFHEIERVYFEIAQYAVDLVFRGNETLNGIGGWIDIIISERVHSSNKAFTFEASSSIRKGFTR